MSINIFEVGNNAICGYVMEEYHYDEDKAAEWYSQFNDLGVEIDGITGIDFVKLMDEGCVEADFKWDGGGEDVHVYDFNSEVVVIAWATSWPVKQVSPREFYNWLEDAPDIVEKVCGNCKHLGVKSGDEPCYSCDSLAGDEFNWEPEE